MAELVGMEAVFIQLRVERRTLVHPVGRPHRRTLDGGTCVGVRGGDREQSRLGHCHRGHCGLLVALVVPHSRSDGHRLAAVEGIVVLVRPVVAAHTHVSCQTTTHVPIVPHAAVSVREANRAQHVNLLAAHCRCLRRRRCARNGSGGQTLVVVRFVVGVELLAPVPRISVSIPPSKVANASPTSSANHEVRCPIAAIVVCPTSTAQQRVVKF